MTTPTTTRGAEAVSWRGERGLRGFATCAKFCGMLGFLTGRFESRRVRGHLLAASLLAGCFALACSSGRSEGAPGTRGSTAPGGASGAPGARDAAATNDPASSDQSSLESGSGTTAPSGATQATSATANDATGQGADTAAQTDGGVTPQPTSVRDASEQSAGEAGTIRPQGPCEGAAARQDLTCSLDAELRFFAEYAMVNDLSLAPDGSVLLTGMAYDESFGPLVGGFDGFLAALDPLGNVLWAKNVGTPEDDFGAGLAVDAAGNIYLVGSTKGAWLAGTPNAGVNDAFLIKYDPSGQELWRTQFGGTLYDSGQAVLVDSANNVYVVGLTVSEALGTPVPGSVPGASDVFVRRFDAAGNAGWTVQLGGAETDQVAGAVLNANGNLLISGLTYGTLPTVSARTGTVDAFVLELDADGSLQWVSQFGVPNASTRAGGITVLGTEVYVVGTTEGALDAAAQGSGDGFIRHLDAEGSLVSGYQFGTAEDDWGGSLGADAAGNLFVGGSTSGSLAGMNAGDSDGFLLAFDRDLTPIRSRQFGWSGRDTVGHLAVNSEGDIYFAVSSPGSESDSWTGGALLGKFTPPF